MLDGIPILSIIIILPLIGGILTFLSNEDSKAPKLIPLIFSGATLVATLLLFTDFNMSIGTFQFEESYTWIESLGISYSLGVDGISMLMIFLTSLLCFLAILFSWDVEHRTKEYMGLMLILEVGVLGVFSALDYFLFYIFWEIVLIPMFFLIGIWGGPRKEYAAIKFFIYTHVASLVMLLAIMAMYFEAAPILEGMIGHPSFGMQDIAMVSGDFGNMFQIAVFGALFFGFGVKMPVVPFHTWLPDAHVEAPTAGSVLLAGLLLKMGSYGIIRIALPTLPDAAEAFVPVLLVVAIVSILYGAFASLAQRDLKKLVAFSSISHMGIVLLGIATLTTVGIAAGVFQMFAHGLVTAVLFMMCGVVQHKAGTREIPLLGGLSPKMPVAATFLTIGFLASLGLPGLVSFPAEFTVFMATFDEFGWLLMIPIASVAITAGYYLWALQRTMFGPMTDKIDVSRISDVDWYEAAPLAVLTVLIVLFGVLPALAWDVISPSVDIIGAILGVL